MTKDNIFNYFEIICTIFRCRSATLDNWVELMLSTTPGQRCDKAVRGQNVDRSHTCGHILSVPYFVSFNFLSAFLVITHQAPFE